MQNIWAAIKTSSIIVLLIGISWIGKAQKTDQITDLLLIDLQAEKQLPQSKIRPYIYKNQPKTIKNSNPISLALGGSLYVYQNFLSQHFSANCLYDPSCSDFSKQAVKEFGLIKGSLLTLDRLNRCNRIAATDLDVIDLNPKSHRFCDPVSKYK